MAAVRYWALALAALILVVLPTGEGFPVSEQYTHSTQLAPVPGKYVLYWKTTGDQPNDEITFEIHAATTGWVGLGFSPNGGMGGSDIVVGGVNDRTGGYLYDRYAQANGWPESDKQNNYELILAQQNTTHTMLKIKRKISTCDTQDYAITNDTIRLLWAMNKEDAQNENSFNKHEYLDRGSRSAMLLVPKKVEQSSVPRGVKMMDFRVNQVNVPNDYHTLYWCKIFKLPDIGKHHLVRFEPLLQPGNEPYLHHVLLYHCFEDMSDYIDKEEPCFNRDNTEHSPMYRCVSRYLAGWAVGGEPITYPETLGYPLFEQGASPYIMLEVHYDNSNYQRGVMDNSGMRIYVTPNLRPTELGTLTLGMGLNKDDMIIPPGQKKFTLRSYCTPDCTQSLPPNGIKLYTAFLHAHKAGTALRVRQIRNGIETAPIFEDSHYDFNYQDIRFANKPITVLPNDTLILDCEFSTLDRRDTTFAGYSTMNEMCFSFMTYYPRITSLISCYSSPMSSTYAKGMGARVTQSRSIGRPSFEEYKPDLYTNPKGGQDITITQYAAEYNWGNSQSDRDMSVAAENFQRALDTGLHWQACSSKPSDGDIRNAMQSINLRRRDPVELREFEKRAVKFFQNQTFPQPRVPYKKDDLCSVGSKSSAPYNSAREVYTHSVIMDMAEKYKLSWRLKDDSIEFEVSVATLGWIGLGFSPNGGMKDADIVVSWIDRQGRPQITDRHATDNGFPMLDSVQNYELLGGSQNNTHTTIAFRRKMNTCDKDDYVLTNDTVKLIWAYSDEKPMSENSFQQHMFDRRGVRSMYLTEPKPEADFQWSPDVKVVEFRSNRVPIPNDYHTMYWCEVFKLPDLDTHHMIKYEPIIQPGNEGVVHHIIAYYCTKDMEKWLGRPEPCFDRAGTNFSEMTECRQQFLAGWAVGATAVTYPKNMGLPMFKRGVPQYVVQEMHYDNSNYRRGVVDSSGLRLYVTPKLREVEIGQLSFGAPVGPQYQMIPSGQTEYTSHFYCPADCTSGIYVMQGMLHAHISAVKIRIRHFRNGKELAPLFADERYDFNYQENRIKHEPVKILPGDEFVTECVYNTVNRNATTFSNHATKDEMCLTFISYYPKSGNIGMCLSYPTLTEQLQSIGLTVNESTGNITAGEGANTPFKQYMEKFDWSRSADLSKKFQKAQRDSTHLVLCEWTESNMTIVNKLLEKHNITGERAQNMRKENSAFDTFMQSGYPKVNEGFYERDVCNANQMVGRMMADGTGPNVRDGQKYGSGSNRIAATVLISIVAVVQLV